MKTAEEFGRAIDDMVWEDELQAITARDAEHRDAFRAEVEAQDAEIERLKAELAAAQATIEQLGKDDTAIAEKLDRAVELLQEVADPQGDDVPIDGPFGKVLLERGRPLHDEILSFLAAPSPTTPTSCTASAGSCNSPAACGEAGKCIDARMREVVAQAESTPVREPWCWGCDQTMAQAEKNDHRDIRCLTPAPPPAESTPVHNKHQADCTLDTDCCCECQSPAQPAPPDDIRARLEGRLRWHDQQFAALDRRLAALEAKVELNAVLCKAATKCTEVGLANVAAALEAKGEPGTHVCDHPQLPCSHPSHHKGAKP